MSSEHWKCGADLIVKQLEQHGVKQIFGIPGAKIDRVFDSLVDSTIETVVVRHEANAAFMAGAVGRLTGKAGVTIATSGPGCSNLATGIATATSEGDPLVALGGSVKSADRLKQVHQSMDTVSMFNPITKFCAEIDSAQSISESMVNAFRHAESGRPGSAFLTFPMDILNNPVESPLLIPKSKSNIGGASSEAIKEAIKMVSQAKNPVILIGLQASFPENALAFQKLLDTCPLPIVGTYQSAGAITEKYFPLFAGRIGLFNNQPGDELLSQADLVVTLGYSPIEYEPTLWNNNNSTIIHIDEIPAEIDLAYCPALELTGNIKLTLETLTDLLKQNSTPKIELSSSAKNILEKIHQQREILQQNSYFRQGSPIHPLTIIHEMQDIINNDVTLCIDMGSFHIWLARYLYSFRARQMLISNGQQTMGVALPWGIGASFVRPSDKIISVSGDGGFMQSSMELETAVRLNTNILHIIWVDNAYNMVEMQEEKKYGRPSGVKFGPIDFKMYAESFGAKGFNVECASQLRSVLREAMAVDGPAVLAIPVDYRDNAKLMEHINYNLII
ncbi:acetolactate synthase AlsS [Proteus myxofaciens]|uniref:Acetolactate synthase, catabolic n=1 Tax=Proteus myxofaciens ATCC 19692 TaxID=1354337 RepID=A0A198GKR3_9GAMM|nr:acetolactate synthase AlsS [Proteus myxofaciens]OAT38052.1 acetolactate synthase, catabolic [Proteus myxofaciens ATCC 19692]